MKEWLAETHGVRFELIRHFLPGFFGAELTGGPGAVAMGASSWMLLFALLFFKYKKLGDLGLHARMPAEAANDVLTLSAIGVCLTALLVAVLWQSLYPSLRDYLALAALPVSGADIFCAKFAAVSLVFTTLLVVAPLPAAVVLGGVAGANVLDSFGTIGGFCAVTFFGLIGLQGILLNILPGRVFEKAMIWLQAALAAAGLGGLSVAFWKGNMLLEGVHLSAKYVLLAPFCALFAYILSYKRYRKLVVEAPTPPPTRIFDWSSRLLDLLLRDPREQAAFGFIWQTVHRSRTHRLAVLVYIARGAAWMGKSLVEMVRTDRARTEVHELLFTVYPLVLLLVTLIGIRHLFSLPVELRANWVFQIADREGRLAWMRALEKFVFLCGIGPVVLIGAALVSRQGGIWVAWAWAAVASLLSAIGFEVLFRDWRKMPFTCSYLPGKRPLVVNCAIFAGIAPLLLIVAAITYSASTNPASVLVLLLLEFAIWRHLRSKRMTQWGIAPLRYVEREEGDVETFDLAGEGTTVAQEEFQRQWGIYANTEPVAPILAPMADGEEWTGRVLGWLKAIPEDTRYAFRAMRRSPGFSATVVLTLGLGLGLNGAFFTIFNAYLLRPLAVREPDSLVGVHFEGRYKTPSHIQWREFEALASGTQAFTEVVANTLEGTGMDGQPARMALVSSNFFSMLGVGASLGRVFHPEDNDRTVVLNHRVWVNRFGSDPQIVGKFVTLHGTRFEVVGVARPEFTGVGVGTVAIAPPKFARFGMATPDCWVLMAVWNKLPGVKEMAVLGVVGRLRPEMTESRAAAILSGYMRRATASRPEYDRIWRVDVESLEVPITWTAMSFSMPLLVAFGLTMLIPCANAANILLARATVRQREFGTRLSLGASRGRVVRQLLVEGVLLATLAAGAGMAVARWSLDLFVQTIYLTAPPAIFVRVQLPEFHLDGTVWFYMALVAGATTMLFALAPAAQATRISLTPALRGEFGGIGGSGLRDALVIGQVSLCVMLLAGSGLLLKGTGNAKGIDRGYDASGVFAVGNESPEDAEALRTMLREETWVDTMAVMGRPPNEAEQLALGAGPGQERLQAYYFRGSGEIFRLLGLPIVRGRTFLPDEGETQAPVAVVSEAAARELWPGQDPIGKTVSLSAKSQRNVWSPRFQDARIVGITRDIVVKVRDGGSMPAIYFPDRLRPGTMVVVRGKGSPAQTRPQLQATLLRAPGAQRGAWVIPLQDALDWETYPQRAVSWLATLLSGVALVLTITGIYGTMSYLVSQRYKEIGIRMALGATAGQITRFVVSYTARLSAAGLVFGMILAVGGLQYLGSKMELLVNLFDVTAYLWVAAVAVCAAGVAGFLPAKRACRVDPHVALRLE